MNEYTSTILKVVPFAIALFVLDFAAKKGKINKHEIGWQRPESRINSLFWILGFAIYAVGIELFLYSQDLLAVHHWEYSVPVKIIRGVGILFLAPLTEEILLRGILLQKLRNKKINTAIAVVIQALIFVLLHSFTYDQSVSAGIGIIQVFIDGVLFAVARLHTRSIFTSIGMHMCGNGIALLERLL